MLRWFRWAAVGLGVEIALWIADLGVEEVSMNKDPKEPEQVEPSEPAPQDSTEPEPELPPMGHVEVRGGRGGEPPRPK